MPTMYLSSLQWIWFGNSPSEKSRAKSFMESFGYGRGLYAKAYDSDGEGFREERLEKMLGGEKNFEEILKDPRMNKLLVFNKSDRSGTKRNFLFVNVTQESGRKEFAKAVKAISDSGKEEITVNLRLDDEKWKYADGGKGVDPNHVANGLAIPVRKGLDGNGIYLETTAEISF